MRKPLGPPCLWDPPCVQGASFGLYQRLQPCKGSQSNPLYTAQTAQKLHGEWGSDREDGNQRGPWQNAESSVRLPVQGPGENDRGVQEQLLNVLTCLPFVLTGHSLYR